MHIFQTFPPHTQTHARTHTNTRTHTRTRTHQLSHTHSQIVYVKTYAAECLYTHAHTTHTHTHTHTHTPIWRENIRRWFLRAHIQTPTHTHTHFYAHTYLAGERL